MSAQTLMNHKIHDQIFDQDDIPILTQCFLLLSCCIHTLPVEWSLCCEQDDEEIERTKELSVFVRGCFLSRKLVSSTHAIISQNTYVKNSSTYNTRDSSVRWYDCNRRASQRHHKKKNNSLIITTMKLSALSLAAVIGSAQAQSSATYINEIQLMEGHKKRSNIVNALPHTWVLL